MKTKALFAMSLLAFATPALAAQVTFSNPNTILINDSSNPPTIAAPYPSTIVVTGLTGQVVTKVTVQLLNITHSFPDDIDILLVGPQGQQSFIMSNVGGSMPGHPVTNLSLTLDDDAANSLPVEAPLVSGTFRPTKKLSSLLFDLPLPAPPANSNSSAALSLFNGTDPNGTWSLFIVDDAAPDGGVISGGWNLAISSISSEPVLLTIARAGTNVVLSWTNSASGFSLQTTTNLTSVWTNATPDPVDVSGRFTVTNPISGTRRFYRLIR